MFNPKECRKEEINKEHVRQMEIKSETVDLIPSILVFTINIIGPVTPIKAPIL